MSFLAAWIATSETEVFQLHSYETVYFYNDKVFFRTSLGAQTSLPVQCQSLDTALTEERIAFLTLLGIIDYPETNCAVEKVTILYTRRIQKILLIQMSLLNCSLSGFD